MDDFIIPVGRAALVFLCVVSASSCSVINVNTRAAAAVAMQAKGADPLDIPCAIGDGTERYCELRAASRGVAK